MLISVSFEFNMGIYCIFLFGSIYLVIIILSSFTLGRLFDFIFVHFWFNGVLYFSLKNLFCGKFIFKNYFQN